MIFFSTATWSLRESGFNLHQPPGKHHDDVFFDNLGWNLSQGNGLAYNFESVAWKQRYLAESSADTIAWINRVRAQGATMGRAPGYPTFLATIYSAAGRDFLIVRGLQIVLLASGLTNTIDLGQRNSRLPLVSRCRCMYVGIGLWCPANARADHE